MHELEEAANAAKTGLEATGLAFRYGASAYAAIRTRFRRSKNEAAAEVSVAQIQEQVLEQLGDEVTGAERQLMVNVIYTEVVSIALNNGDVATARGLALQDQARIEDDGLTTEEELRSLRARIDELLEREHRAKEGSHADK
jgi:hypothetical protein